MFKAIVKGKKVVGGVFSIGDCETVLVSIDQSNHRVHEFMKQRELETFLDYFGYRVPPHLDETLSPT